MHMTRVSVSHEIIVVIYMLKGAGQTKKVIGILMGGRNVEYY